MINLKSKMTEAKNEKSQKMARIQASWSDRSMQQQTYNCPSSMPSPWPQAPPYSLASSGPRGLQLSS